MGYNVSDKIILVDCDGVLCDWGYAFTQWMEHTKGFKTINDDEYNIADRFGLSAVEGKNMVREFNDSAAIGFLPPLRDSVYYMKRLNMMHGYKFVCITSLSKNKYAQRLRTQNLKMLFGEELWEDFVYLGCGEDKDKELEKFKDTGCWWIEDKPANCKAGKKVGLRPILVGHDHNHGCHDYIRFSKWKYIYKYIVGE
tara:strand:+ start:79 stop:669 length:591 start_codon:yes stop_codon:yes gene_type:complete